MNGIRIFIDFGSTFTKMVAFDLESETVAGRVQVPSTVDRDITCGLEEAFAAISREVKVGALERKQAVACSSAAGGLRIVCVGLVPDYTTKAGRMAALGAGARIVGEYSFELSAEELAEIEEIAPDIVLLTGGTDGGNKKVLLYNASLLARSGREIRNVIVAGNKSAYDEIKSIFAGSDKKIIFTRNVMPELGVLDVDPANREIRELFINQITAAKGIDKVKTIIDAVIMPTPAALLEAARLLADGAPGCPGLGELLLVDVGGATTDVYSVAKGASTKEAVTMAGLPEPYVKRTVEGDLGLVHNREVLYELAQAEPHPDRFEETFQELYRNGMIPKGEAQEKVHHLLGRLAVKSAVDRHVGRIEMIATPGGAMPVQRGKDLTEIKTVIGSGGAISFSRNPLHLLEGALFQETVPALLKPKNPVLMLDHKYILFAVGLLAKSDPVKAFRIGRKYLRQLA